MVSRSSCWSLSLLLVCEGLELVCFLQFVHGDDFLTLSHTEYVLVLLIVIETLRAADVVIAERLFPL